MEDRPERDRGQASLLLVVAVLVVALTGLVLVAEVGGVIHDRGRARTAADAAALAGVEGGRPAAEALARDNGAVLERWQAGPDGCEVTVRFGHARATARARPGGAEVEWPPEASARYGP